MKSIHTSGGQGHNGAIVAGQASCGGGSAEVLRTAHGFGPRVVIRGQTGGAAELGGGVGGLAKVLARYEIEGTRVWCVFDGDVLAGAVALTYAFSPQRGDTASLWGAYVLPRYRGTAASRQLMEAVFACCEQECGIKLISARFASGNLHARQFFERFGFDKVKSSATPSGHEDGLIRMRREV